MEYFKEEFKHVDVDDVGHWFCNECKTVKNAVWFNKNRDAWGLCQSCYEKHFGIQETKPEGVKESCMHSSENYKHIDKCLHACSKCTEETLGTKKAEEKPERIKIDLEITIEVDGPVNEDQLKNFTESVKRKCNWVTRNTEFLKCKSKTTQTIKYEVKYMDWMNKIIRRVLNTDLGKRVDRLVMSDDELTTDGQVNAATIMIILDEVQTLKEQVEKLKCT